MTTLVYSPAIQVHIATASHGIIDVSDDLSSGSLTLAENSLAHFSFTLNNHRRKYDGLFTPNDRIVVRMKRIKWVQVMAGYLDEVPFFSVSPRVIQMSASCTLKKLMYRYWDAGSDAAYQLLSTIGTGNDAAAQVDGGIREKLVALLTQVGGWPQSHIHLGQIPSNWYSTVTELSAQVSAATAQNGTNLGTSPVFGGEATTQGTLVQPSGSPNFMCALPATSGKCSAFGGPSDASTLHGFMALTGEPGAKPHDDWYCAMRWGYYAMDADGVGHHPVGTTTQQNAAINWLRNRKLVVTNPRNGKAVVVRAADWGPGGLVDANARAIDLSPRTLKILGLDTDGQVDIRWAPNQSLNLGPITAKALAGAVGKTLAQAKGEAVAAKQDRLDQVGVAQVAAEAASPAGKPTFALPFTLEPWNGGYNKPHVHAAKVYIMKNWPFVTGCGGYSPGTGHIAGSEHYTGHALDIDMGIHSMPNQAQQARGNSIALWLVTNPDYFGVTQVIWRAHIITRDRPTWRPYQGPPGADRLSLDHWNHIHVSFDHNDTRTAPGAPGTPWSTINDPFFTSVGVTTPGGQGLVPASGGSTDSTGADSAGGAPGQGNNLLNAFNWTGSPDPTSTILTGPRVLMNDAPLLGTIQQLCQAGMRSYMAAPNGDFIGWFPDYFDNYKIAGKLHIADVELMSEGFTIQWSDANLITHQFTAGAPTGYSEGSAPGEAVDIYQQYLTQGIVTVEFPKIMESLFNINPNSPEAAKFLNAAGILNRYGARPDFQSLGTITGPQAEFWYALSLFQRNWASQFSSSVETTFMPEAWPGMLIVIDSLKFQAYVTSVTHTFNFSNGGGFSTAINVIAPSSLDGGGLYGLPRGGGTVARPKKKPVKQPAKKTRHG